MAIVPQTTLNWLYDVLRREYREPHRAYADLAQALTQYPTLTLRTDVHTFETGTSALLVHVVGTIPVSFQGTIYRIPIALWVPHAYPYEAPLVYVDPTEGMVVRPGQHVSGDGRVYHHYLAHWGGVWDGSNVVELLSFLSSIFAQEPPVMSKQQQQMARPLAQRTTLQSGPPKPPPLPQELQRESLQPDARLASQPSPPTPPPKEASIPEPTTYPGSERLGRYVSDSALPGQLHLPQSIAYEAQILTQAAPSGHTRTYAPRRNATLSQSTTLHQVPASPDPRGQPYQAHRHTSIPISSPHRAGHPLHAQLSGPQPQLQAVQTSPVASAIRSRRSPLWDPLQSASRPERVPLPSQRSQAPQEYPLQQHQQPIPQQTQPQLPSRAAPRPVNLLDSPFDISLPVAPSDLPAPPIPRNPEKEALLSALSLTLTQTLHNAINQNASALPSLQAQHAALTTTARTLDTELANLKSLNSDLSSNINILQSSIHAANGAIAAARERAARGDIPNIDEMLTAPTVVGKQLYDVVCEERGIEAGIWALQEGFVRGRMGVELWAKRTRELAREGFRRRALAQKIGRGLGLEGTHVGASRQW